ncbi:hypothetical protein GGR49_002344 [Sphingomonas carotinifaciens]|nr:hypothetical protein [Sphingomonas carotinifaciens]
MRMAGLPHASGADYRVARPSRDVLPKMSAPLH